MITCYKNKESGKLFIEIDAENSLFINPEGRILELDRSLFMDDPIELEDDSSEVEKHINQKQLRKHKKYTDSRIRDFTHFLFKSVENATHQQLETEKRKDPEFKLIIEAIEQAIKKGKSSADFE
jgi:hypothetical protein